MDVHASTAATTVRTVFRQRAFFGVTFCLPETVKGRRADARRPREIRQQLIEEMSGPRK
jgi:hypothetical protein